MATYAEEAQVEERVLDAALAGMLHDIGKFSLRAGRGKNERWDNETRDAIKYEHALASYGFVQQYVPKDWRAGLSGVAYHHRPKTTADRWVQLADWMSSAEREQDEDANVPVLQTIFSRVGSQGTPAYWPLRRLDYASGAAMFPVGGAGPQWRETYQKQYAELWDEFENACRSGALSAATTLSKRAYLENLLSTLQEFTWCIPSAYWNSVPDVSLFDHLRTTAALAACVAADDRPDEWCRGVWADLTAGRASQGAALLVGADFTGIQDFIYTLASSGAAKSLRARSFYLQVLGEVIAINVVRDLGLPLTNLLYVGGGGFQLLAPVSAASQLPAIEQALTDKLLVAHRGALGVSLEWTEVKAHEFRHFSAVHDRLRQALSRKKQRPFARASPALLAEHIGVPLTLGGDPLTFCRVTGDDWDVQYRDGEYKTGFVWSLEELGRQLPRATHLILSEVAAGQNDRPKTWQAALAQFGVRLDVVLEKETPNLNTPGFTRIWRLDPHREVDARLAPALASRPDVALSARPLAKLVPRDARGEVLTFDRLAEKAQGIERWGVLRMDVDNLGGIFREGLGDNATLSRIASLSFGLRFFFEGLLPGLSEAEAQDRLYIQYAGGDDVFVVGAWDALPRFALQIREQFGRFTAKNPAFTLSAGIALVDANFPLYQAARMAGEAETAAKTYRRLDGRAKDAVYFLGHVCEWQEFTQMAEDAGQLAAWVKGGIIPSALLQTFQALAQQIRQAEETASKQHASKPQYGRWMWMAAYHITRALGRMRGRSQEVETAKQKIAQMQATFLTPGAQGERVGMTARWAQFLARGGNRHE